MAKAIVIGDGPAGLSAALFLAKNGVDTVVYAQDNTAMHKAYLYNYLGLDDVSGTEFQRRAREQATGQGAQLRDDEVTEASSSSGSFTVRTASGAEDSADYLVLAGGKGAGQLAEQLGVEASNGRVGVDEEGRTSVAGVYAAGRLTRPDRSQAVISAGAGGRAALDILAREAGKDVVDWDTPPKQ